MNPLAILGLKAFAVLAAVAAIGWGIHALDQSRQQIGYDRRVAEDNAALIEAQEAARATERALNAKLETAAHEAARRETDLRTTAAAGRAASERLRIALDAIRDRVPADPAAARPDATGPLAELLGDCAGQYRDLAEAADRHASDARTLMEAWPR